MSTQLLSLDDLLALKRQGVADLGWVEVFAVGRHKPGDKVWTADDLRDCEANFERFSGGDNPPLAVPVGIGHEDDQAWLADTGLPAAGRVSRVKTDGERLWVWFADLPAKVAEAVKLGLWFRVSCEFYDDPPDGLAGSGCTLRRVALIGGDIPAVKGLAAFPALRMHAELRRLRAARPPAARRPATTVRSTRGTIFTFTEGRIAMDETTKATLIAVIKAAMPNLTDEFLATLDDEQLQMLAAQASGAAPGGDAAGAAAATAAEPPADRATLIADIIAADPTQDQAALEGMTDDELKALWQQLVGAARDAAAAGAGADTSANTEGAGSAAAAAAPAAGPATSRAAAAPTLTPAQAAQLQRQFAELNGTARRLEQDAKRRERLERERTVKAYCERWLDKKFVTPSEVDPKSKTPNVYHRLMAATPTVRRYGERAMSEFDAVVAEIEARGPGFARFFAEKVPAGGGNAAKKAEYDKARADALARHAAVKTGSTGDPLAKRLGLLTTQT